MNDEFMYGIRIPKERIPVLIGTNGDTKKSLEDKLSVKISVDSEEGDVTITGNDGLSVFTAREVVKAISRGFNPEYALLLLKQDYSLELIEIRDFAKSKKQLIRKRGRVIGEKGRSRRTIEELTDTHISVYGKTVGIIGRIDDVLAAKKAVEALLGEATHAGVYKTLEKRRRNLRRDEALWAREEIDSSSIFDDKEAEEDDEDIEDGDIDDGDIDDDDFPSEDSGDSGGSSEDEVIDASNDKNYNKAMAEEEELLEEDDSEARTEAAALDVEDEDVEGEDKNK